MNENLGQNYNQVNRWETGKVSPTWKQFISFCLACEVDVAKMLSGEIDELNKNDPSDHGHLFTRLIGNSTVIEAQEFMNISRKNLGKWIKGEGDPPLETVFQLFEIRTSGLYLFVRHLVAPEMYERFGDLVTWHIKRQEYFNRFPALTILLYLLQVNKPKKYKEGMFAKALSISTKEEVEMIDALEELSLAKKIHGTIVPVEVAPNFRGDWTHEGWVKNWQQVLNLSENLIKTLPARRPKKAMHYLFKFRCTEEERVEVVNAMKRFQSDMWAIFQKQQLEKNSKKMEHVYVFQHTLVPILIDEED